MVLFELIYPKLLNFNYQNHLYLYVYSVKINLLINQWAIMSLLFQDPLDVLLFQLKEFLDLYSF